MSTGHVTGRKGLLCTPRGSANTWILTLCSPASLTIEGRTSSWLPGTDGLHLPRSGLEKSHPVCQQKFLQSIKSLLLNKTLIYFPLFVLWETSFGILQFYFSPMLSVREKIICSWFIFVWEALHMSPCKRKHSVPSCEVSCIANVLLLFGSLSYIGFLKSKMKSLFWNPTLRLSEGSVCRY